MNKYFRLYNFNSSGQIHHSLRLFGISCWAFYYQNRFGWFRIFGKGLKWKDVSIHALCFSERYGYTNSLQIGKWKISLL